MADLTITTLAIDNGIPPVNCRAGAAISIGDVCYLSAGKYYKAQSDGTAAEAAAKVIALTAAAGDGSYFAGVPTGSHIKATGVFSGAEIFILSRNAGKIAPVADLASGDYITILGFRVSNDVMLFDPTASGYEKA